MLKSRRVPLVFCSSKTRAEQDYYRQAIGLDEPFIVENGSAIILPAGYFAESMMPPHRSLDDFWVVELGLDAATILEKLGRIREEYRLNMRGYADMTDAELSQLTGLGDDETRRARQREYSETILAELTEKEWSRFRRALAEERLTCISGGQLYTVTSSASSKGRAVRVLIDLYSKSHGPIRTYGIGDSPNDRGMLQSMDVAYQIQRTDGTWYDMRLPGIHRVGVGPRGWQEAIASIMGSPLPGNPVPAK